jgi:hypothetical protein
MQPILEKIDSPKVIGVGIVSSYACGQAGKHREVVNKTLHLIKEAGYL